MRKGNPNGSPGRVTIGQARGGTIESFLPWGIDTERGSRTNARNIAEELHCRTIWRGDDGETWEYTWFEGSKVRTRLICLAGEGTDRGSPEKTGIPGGPLVPTDIHGFIAGGVKK
jgi:hypothetical protein